MNRNEVRTMIRRAAERARRVDPRSVEVAVAARIITPAQASRLKQNAEDHT